MFDTARELGLGVMAYGPMAHGLLTGAFTRDTAFDETDWRRRGSIFGQQLLTPENLPRNLEVVDELRALATELGTTLTPLALAWVLRDPVVSVALSGTRRPEEIEENVRALEVTLHPGRAAAHRRHHGGRRRPDGRPPRLGPLRPNLGAGRGGGRSGPGRWPPLRAPRLHRQGSPGDRGLDHGVGDGQVAQPLGPADLRLPARRRWPGRSPAAPGPSRRGRPPGRGGTAGRWTSGASAVKRSHHVLRRPARAVQGQAPAVQRAPAAPDEAPAGDVELLPVRRPRRRRTARRPRWRSSAGRRRCPPRPTGKRPVLAAVQVAQGALGLEGAHQAGDGADRAADVAQDVEAVHAEVDHRAPAGARLSWRQGVSAMT